MTTMMSTIYYTLLRKSSYHLGLIVYNLFSETQRTQELFAKYFNASNDDDDDDDDDNDKKSDRLERSEEKTTN